MKRATSGNVDSGACPSFMLWAFIMYRYIAMHDKSKLLRSVNIRSNLRVLK